jgi:hypothetical protein
MVAFRPPAPLPRHEIMGMVRLDPPGTQRATGIAAAGSALFLVGTAADRSVVYGAESGIAATLLQHTDLGSENVLAAWWTAALLMGVAAASVLCWARCRTRADGRRMVALAWLGVAAACVLLSLDELGAVHERLRLGPPGSTPSMLQDANLLTLALAAAVGPVLAFVLALIRTRHRVSAALVVAALGLFGVAVLADHEEAPVLPFLAPDETGRPLVALLVEEGAELGGVLLLLAAALYFLADAAPQRRMVGGDEDVPLELSFRSLRIAGLAAPFIAGAGMIAMLLLQEGVLEHRRYDDPIIWFPSMLALGAAAGVVFAARRMVAGWRLLPVAGVAALVAVDVGAAELVSNQLWPGSPRRSLVIALFVGTAAVGALGLAWTAFPDPAVRLGLALWGVGVAAGWAAAGTLRVVVLFAAHAALIPALAYAVAPRQRAPDPGAAT